MGIILNFPNNQQKTQNPVETSASLILEVLSNSLEREVRTFRRTFGIATLVGIALFIACSADKDQKSKFSPQDYPSALLK